MADLGWFVSAWLNAHSALLAKQTVYIILNVVGYMMWRRDERLREELERLENRVLEKSPEKEAVSS